MSAGLGQVRVAGYWNTRRFEKKTSVSGVLDTDNRDQAGGSGGPGRKSGWRAFTPPSCTESGKGGRAPFAAFLKFAKIFVNFGSIESWPDFGDLFGWRDGAGDDADGALRELLVGEDLFETDLERLQKILLLDQTISSLT
jgi:hypothetical protein